MAKGTSKDVIGKLNTAVVDALANANMHSRLSDLGVETVSLAFLAPDLVKAAIDGHLPHGLGIARLCDLPIEWARQHQTLGLATY